MEIEENYKTRIVYKKKDASYGMPGDAVQQVQFDAYTQWFIKKQLELIRPAITDQYNIDFVLEIVEYVDTWMSLKQINHIFTLIDRFALIDDDYNDPKLMLEYQEHLRQKHLESLMPNDTTQLKGMEERLTELTAIFVELDVLDCAMTNQEQYQIKSLLYEADDLEKRIKEKTKKVFGSTWNTGT